MLALRRCVCKAASVATRQSRLALATRQMSTPATTKHVLEFDTLAEMFVKSTEANAQNDIFGTRVGDEYKWMKYSEFAREVQKFRNVLAAMDFGYDDKIAVISNNRVEWAVIAFAAATRGGHIVPMYEAQLESDWRYIVEDSDSKVVVAATEAIHEKVKGYAGTVGKVTSVLSLGTDAEVPHTYAHWMRKVESEAPVDVHFPKPSDLATIIYTSGTTGKPKGVELTHENIVSNLKGLDAVWGPKFYGSVSLAFLPWAHVYGQTCELYTLMASGSSMGIVSNREQILDSLPLVRPTMICSVPTLFNKVYDGVMAKIAGESPLKQKIFRKALQVARERSNALEFGRQPGFLTALQHKIFDKIVFSKIRDRFGGRLNYMCAGGAATSVTVLQFFEDIGIPICEGYGLTETSPVISAGANNWETRRLGTAGVTMPNIDVCIKNPANLAENYPADTEGEICVSGPSVMKGYRKNQAANDEVFYYEPDGKKRRFFRTGDLGMMVDGKFLKITGRIKEQYKLENGKYVVPAPLEDKLCRSRYIAQTFVYGDNKPFNIALIVPEMAELRAWADRLQLDYKGDDGVLMNMDETIGMLSKELLECSATMKSYEKPQKWTHTLEIFTQENYLLTPKMSLRRNNVWKLYGDRMLSLYEEHDQAGVRVRHMNTASDLNKQD